MRRRPQPQNVYGLSYRQSHGKAIDRPTGNLLKSYLGSEGDLNKEIDETLPVKKPHKPKLICIVEPERAINEIKDSQTST